MGLQFGYTGQFHMSHYLAGEVLKNAYTSTSYSADQIYYVAGRVSKNDGTVNISVNGTDGNPALFGPGAAAREYGVNSWRIGQTGRDGDLTWRGNAERVIDEIRISNTTRSSAWINATYYSLFDQLITFEP